MKVHHIGYLVKEIVRSIKAFEALGYHLRGDVQFDDGRLADICFMENSGYCVELIAPHRESDLYPLLKQYQNAPYHMCYCCENLESTIELLKADRYMLFKSPATAPAIGKSARVAFLMHARVGMIELVED